MKHRNPVMVLIIFLFVPPGYLLAATPSFNTAFIDAASRAKPSVVNITVYKEKKDNKKVLIKTAEGSGVIINRFGIIVTNNHVLDKGDVYRVSYHDGTPCELGSFDNGEKILTDAKTDIALLRIEGYKQSVYPPVNLGNSSRLSEGEWVIAIGNPYGLRQSISCGVVSFKGRDNIGFVDIEDFIQTDVSINPGNSGGPLINLDGEMVGINTAIRTISGGYQGISFSIPSNIVRMVCGELLSYGRVRRGWLGFVARERRIDNAYEGAVVEILRVMKNSPAWDAGLRYGDIIREIDGSKISTVSRLVKEVSNRPVGSKIHIIISRNAKLSDITLVLREKQVYRKIQSMFTVLINRYGIELDEIAEDNNVVVSSLSPRSAGSGLKQGDIIQSLNGRKIKTLEDFCEQFQSADGIIQTLDVARESGDYVITFIEEEGTR